MKQMSHPGSQGSFSHRRWCRISEYDCCCLVNRVRPHHPGCLQSWSSSHSDGDQAPGPDAGGSCPDPTAWKHHQYYIVPVNFLSYSSHIQHKYIFWKLICNRDQIHRKCHHWPRVVRCVAVVSMERSHAGKWWFPTAAGRQPSSEQRGSHILWDWLCLWGGNEYK